MRTRKWLKFYDENSSVEAGITTDTDGDAICLRLEDYEQIPNITEVRLTTEEAKELACFLLKIAGELE